MHVKSEVAASTCNANIAEIKTNKSQTVSIEDFLNTEKHQQAATPQKFKTEKNKPTSNNANASSSIDTKPKKDIAKSIIYNFFRKAVIVLLFDFETLSLP